jgi:hypothetical protein
VRVRRVKAVVRRAWSCIFGDDVGLDDVLGIEKLNLRGEYESGNSEAERGVWL